MAYVFVFEDEILNLDNPNTEPQLNLCWANLILTPKIHPDNWFFLMDDSFCTSQVFEGTQKSWLQRLESWQFDTHQMLHIPDSILILILGFSFCKYTNRREALQTGSLRHFTESGVLLQKSVDFMRVCLRAGSGLEGGYSMI